MFFWENRYSINKYEKIFIIPSVRKRYKNQIEHCIDKRIFFLLKKTFKKFEIKSELHKSINLIIILGGNDLTSIEKKQENIIKENPVAKLEEKYDLFYTEEEEKYLADEKAMADWAESFKEKNDV